MSKIDLLLDRRTIQDIVDEIYRKFLLNTDNISFHFEEHAIHIIVYPGKHTHFHLPGGPVDVRLNNDTDRWEYIGRQRAY